MHEPSLLGRLEFDRTQGRFTKCDIVALGDTYGKLGGDLKYLYRPGRHPMGIAFELSDGSRPADRVPPRGMRFPKSYWATGKAK